MLEGMYAAAAGMEAQQTQLDAISNDIANVDTTGYQSEQIGFRDLLYTTDNDLPSTAIVGSGAAASTIGYSQTQGSLEQTGNPLDLALDGSGYFQVRLANGSTGLTRNGTFQLNATGQITTSTGLELVPPITVPHGTKASDISIGADGTVNVGARRIGKISVVEVPAPDKLLPQGNSVFVATAASGSPQAASTVAIQQGYLEGSNVDLTAEMSNMETTDQAYDMASKAISFEAQLGQIAATLK